VTPALPPRARNRLAGVIVSALRDVRAREELAALAAAPENVVAREWLRPEQRTDARALRERARRASRAVASVAIAPGGGALAEALAGPAALFDAGLYFEAHEALEPWWRAARGEAREALQGLVQVAAGYHHLASGNPGPARRLLSTGSARLHGRALAGLALGAFARAVARSMDCTHGFDGARVPPFPRRERG